MKKYCVATISISLLSLVCSCTPVESGMHNANGDSSQLAIVGQIAAFQDDAIVLKLASGDEVSYSIDNGNSIIEALADDSAKKKNRIVTIPIDQDNQEIVVTATDAQGRVVEKVFNANRKAVRDALPAWEGVDCEFDEGDVEEVELLAGGDDDFTGAEDGGEFAPTAHFLANYGLYVGQSQKLFDVVGIDKWVAASFDLSAYKGKILCGSVQFHLRNAGSLWNTDGVSLYSYKESDDMKKTDCNSDDRLQCWVTPIRDYISSWTIGNDMMFNYNLKDLPKAGGNVNMIEHVNETGMLHAYTQDDVTVDYYRIRLLVKKSDDDCVVGNNGLQNGNGKKNCSWVENNILKNR